ncbi:chaperonin 10-like protein [Aspergillus caelatus]|uniref:Chaperonin 10-like protein n=1 Tax=Aspergillus caelatus TaxID=61420 RepID=A0A5N7ANX5_9EURO|nr:chaperonin 10-like protein [Aspergillus caelatus]KAE8370699.1 chaperonin 10-like protein [Aspergillus caelatus]
MKEIINLHDCQTKLVESAIPEINDDQVLIRVVVSGSNPKDWKVPDLAHSEEKPYFERYEKVRQGVNQGDDIAGVVEKVGKNVVEFQPGDRVGAFHEMLMPGGSYAEYAVAWSHTTFHLPEKISFEEAATIPLAGLTAVVSLYHHLGFQLPWSPAAKGKIPSATTPFIVYGASTAVGSYAIKLARLSNIHPIIAIAGKGAHYIRKFLDESKGDVVVDYREGPEKTAAGIRNALRSSTGDNDLPANHALDTIVTVDSTAVLRSVMNPGGNINYVLMSPPDVSPAVASNTWVSSAHQIGGVDDCRDLCFVFCRWFTRALQSGELESHPFEVRKDGLMGIEGAMRDLRDGKASAVKYVFRIGETPGLEKSA